MINRILRQLGLATFSVCFLASTVEIHDTYKLYVDHENAKIAGIHEAYQRSFDAAMGHKVEHDHVQREIDQLASVIDVNQLMPAQTVKKMKH